MKTIVVGIDGSQASHDALRWAHDEALLRDAELVVVHAWQATSVPTYAGIVAAPYYELAREDVQEQAEELIQRALEGAGITDLAQVDARAVEGPPGRALVDIAQGADMLVVGSRGHGGFAELLLGSVSAQVAHHAPCPVVIVRPTG